jgi:hypothetical protein
MRIDFNELSKAGKQEVYERVGLVIDCPYSRDDAVLEAIKLINELIEEAIEIGTARAHR